MHEKVNACSRFTAVLAVVRRSIPPEDSSDLPLLRRRQELCTA
jgi:hypothetical protein